MKRLPNSTQDTLIEALLDPGRLRTFDLPTWEAVIACGRRNAVLAYLAQRAEALGVIEDLPPAPRAALHSARTAAARLAQLARFELDRVRRALQPSGIPIIALKGAAYLLRDMPHASTRILSDVDVMVPRAQIDAAERALLTGGWKATNLDAYDQSYYRRWSHEIPPLQYPGRLLAVDVHHTIVPPVSRLRPDAAAFWTDAVPSAIDGIALLSPVDSLLHAAVHLFFDSDFDGRFRDLVDLHEMFVAFGAAPDFWPRLVARAEAQGLSRPLYYACVTSAAVLRTAIPGEVTAALQAHRPAAPVDAWMRRTLTTLLSPADATRWPPEHRRRVWLMYVRSHWLRMPPHLLVPHLVRKSLRRGRAPAAVDGQA